MLNIVPKDCSFEFEFRCIAGHDGRALYEKSCAMRVRRSRK